MLSPFHHQTKPAMAIRNLFVFLFLCVLWKDVGADDGIAALSSRTPSILDSNFRLRQFFFPPPPSPPPPPPPPPSPPPPPPSNAVLFDIYVSSGTLVPPFNESIFTYTVAVDSSVSELQVSVIVPQDEVEAGYEVVVNGTSVDSGASGPTFDLANEGETVTIYIHVVATGYSSTLYTIYATREESSSSGGGGGLSWWEILLIVVACVVVVLLIAGFIYWAFQKGWFSSASKSTTDYQAIAN